MKIIKYKIPAKYSSTSNKKHITFNDENDQIYGGWIIGNSVSLDLSDEDLSEDLKLFLNKNKVSYEEEYNEYGIEIIIPLSFFDIK